MMQRICDRRRLTIAVCFSVLIHVAVGLVLIMVPDTTLNDSRILPHTLLQVKLLRQYVEKSQQDRITASSTGGLESKGRDKHSTLPNVQTIGTRRTQSGKILHDNRENNEAQITETDLGNNTMDAQQLISNSLEFIRSYEFDEYMSGKRSFSDSVYPNVRIIGEQEVDVLRNGGIESYRLSDGTIKVKMSSPFGGIQCFEVHEPDPFDVFDVGAWMFTQC